MYARIGRKIPILLANSIIIYQTKLHSDTVSQELNAVRSGKVQWLPHLPSVMKDIFKFSLTFSQFVFLVFPSKGELVEKIMVRNYRVQK